MAGGRRWRVLIHTVTSVRCQVATNGRGSGATSCLCGTVGVVASWEICAATVSKDLRDWTGAGQIGIAHAVVGGRREEQSVGRRLLAG